ncbi:MAG: ATP-binding protein [Treponemataceae bacterium]|nr:ATP-binding protein [Treponemataceae bacterium]
MDNFGLSALEKSAHIQKYNHALFANMAHCTDAVWELDITHETVFIMHDRFEPSRAQTTFSFEQLQDKVYRESHPDYRDSICFLFRTEYVRNLCDSVSFNTLMLIDGSYHHLKCVMTPVYDSHGQVMAAYVTIQDIQNILDEWSSHREHQKELKRYLSAVNCGIIQYSRAARSISFANDMALKMFGFSSLEELKTNSTHGFERNVPAEDVRRLTQLVSTLKTENDVAECEFQLTRRDGTTGAFLATVRMLMNDGQEPIIQLSIIEVTSYRELHARLDAAEQANQAKTVFLNNMSHDIRTPMNAIIGYTDLIRTHLDDQNRVLDYLSKISASSQHLLNLINDVLDMSRIESGKVAIEESENNLTDLIEGIRTMVKSSVLEKQLTLVIPPEPLKNPDVWCDRLRINRILLNCLGNSIKFTESGGTVGVSVAQISDPVQGKASYQFKVWDTGIGMSPEFLEHFFEPFEREQNSTVSGIQGTGLGMSITKNIVDLMGGKIAVTSEKGKGTEITITLELRTAAVKKPVPAEPEGPAAGDIKNLYVLLAEDNLLNREIATVILEDAGATVDVAENGLEAVKKVEGCTGKLYDLILMDIQMPVMNGYQASREIRGLSDPAKAAIPIIAMTANAFEEDKRRALESGMNAHIAKPIQIDAVFETIANTLRLR